ncbi:MAG: hypothetical protein ACW98X_21835 [Promethearchaeota archaeon]|jgi:hypothetical protein
MKRRGVRKGTINRYGNFLIAVKNYCDHKDGIISSKDLAHGIKNYKISKLVSKTIKEAGILNKIERGEYKWVAGRVTKEMVSRLAQHTYMESLAARKNKKTFTPPSTKEVSDYFEENGYKKELGVKFITHYADKDWTQSNKNKIKNWKKVAQNVWFGNEINDKYKIKTHKDMQIELEYPKEDILTKEMTLEEAFPNYVDSRTTAPKPVKQQKRIKLFWGLIDITI